MSPLELAEPIFHITIIIQLNCEFTIYTDLPNTKGLLIRESSTWVIGRAPDCAIVLSDQMISRVHAMLSHNDQCGFFITDLRSQNGTLLNRRRLPPLQHYLLKDRDILVLPHNAIQINIHFHS
ncbi:FHA domain-containing protein [Oscillatoria sp. CS-180]|uniref:FHA domain-containing protein n=1 Tax=Oscillatoria sp. CS-180 TaxID=3021720 RepID=UPI00232ADD3A|nr:FHA domain-containing protein [Oscillatoria sp. CS-180]MDB9526488.1 FHA domain-containing protein [Oscillatoria sp. CS-180]